MTPFSWRPYRLFNCCLGQQRKLSQRSSGRSGALQRWKRKQYQGYGYGRAILSRKYRGKLSWDWRRELRAYGDISLAILALCRAAILFMMKGRDATRVSYLYCDLTCKLGARIGFIRGTLRRESEYG